MKKFVEEREKVLIIMGMAIALSGGAFLLLCGLLQIRVSEIGIGACLGYVTGLAGVFTFLLLIFNCSDYEKSAGRNGEYPYIERKC